ncbi:MAG: ACT domain-containing protein [Spirochaetia bacterium]
MAKQVNVFMENKPGRIRAITSLLREHHINIRALTIQDRGDYGMMKMIVDQPADANLLLSENGFASALKDIVAIQISDVAGGLHDFVTALEETQTSIKDAYGFVIRNKEKAVFCLEVQNYEKIVKSAKEKGFNVLEDDELYEL